MNWYLLISPRFLFSQGSFLRKATKSKELAGHHLLGEIWSRLSLGLAIGLFLTVNTPGLSWSGQNGCGDVLARGYLSVMTLNMLYADFADRDARLTVVADYIAQQDEVGEPVDLILLQEVVGGALPRTDDSSRQLQTLLSLRGLGYNRSTRFYYGQRSTVLVGNAILSRCRMVFTLGAHLPTIPEKPYPFVTLPFPRNVVMARVVVPDAGSIDVFTTHLCSYCEPQERLSQGEVLLEFIRNVQRLPWWEPSPAILAGDFNIDLNISANAPLQERILSSGFEDAYSMVHQCRVCCDQNDGTQGCTYGVVGNPYGEGQARIDYVFVKGLQVIDSRVVFNRTPQWVSDHSAVLVRITLPGR